MNYFESDGDESAENGVPDSGMPLLDQRDTNAGETTQRWLIFGVLFVISDVGQSEHTSSRITEGSLFRKWHINNNYLNIGCINRKISYSEQAFFFTRGFVMFKII